MSTSVLPQLLEVDSELSIQASGLELQLNELREKRKGIQTVIAMFESGVAPQLADLSAITSNRMGKRMVKSAAPKTAPAAAKVAKVKSPRAVAKAKTAKVAAKAPKAAVKATKEEVKAPKEKATAKVKATRGRPVKVSAKVSAKTTKAVTVKKQPAGVNRSGRTANWQRYVQDSYSKAPLPDVIVGVLQAQPNNIFKIADVMSAVFKEDMPKNHFLKARNRVSNILSAGARDGDWFRGRGGTYSVSEKAIKAVG
jgi:hypothetical protein